MPTNTSEKGLQKIVLNYLHDHQGYEVGSTNDFDKTYALDIERIKRFLIATQKQKVESTACFASPNTERNFFNKLAQQLATRGVTDVLRKGFRFLELGDMYYPLPSKLNPMAQ